MTSFVVQTWMLWAAIALYIGATVLFAHAIMFAHPERTRWALLALLAALLPHSTALVLRWVAVGHGPYMMKYEVLCSNAWIAAVMLLILAWRRPTWAGVAFVALPAVILMMGLGLFSNPAARDLPPTLRSMWLVFHVLFNKLAVGAFLLSAASAAILLKKLNGRTGGLLDRLPEQDVIEAYTIRFVGFGFLFWSITIGAGAIWADQSWGRYWGWDPIETWSLVTWLSYGTLLHLRRFFRLKARPTAWGTLACFAVSVLTIFIFPFLVPSSHSAYFQ